MRKTWLIIPEDDLITRKAPRIFIRRTAQFNEIIIHIYTYTKLQYYYSSSRCHLAGPTPALCHGYAVSLTSHHRHRYHVPRRTRIRRLAANAYSAKQTFTFASQIYTRYDEHANPNFLRHDFDHALTKIITMFFFIHPSLTRCSQGLAAVQFESLHS